MTTLTSLDQLRAYYGPAKTRSVQKQLAYLDPHCQHFIQRSPLLLLASSNQAGWLDTSPRGGAPGFCKILDQQRLLIPDAPGNNRLDSLANLLENPRLGLLFLLPGVDETLRVNGRASLDTRMKWRELCQDERRLPKLVICVEVEEAYIHCAKALMRAKLWDPGSQIERSSFPSMGEIMRDHIGEQEIQESQAQMLARYQQEL